MMHDTLLREDDTVVVTGAGPVAGPIPMEEERDMSYRRSMVLITIAAILIMALGLPALAAAPPAPWIAKDIGEPGAKGSTDVDANGVWTLKGDGDDIFGTADNFQFAYQLIKGDASISIRFLTMEPVEPSWTKVGVMVRENDTAGSPAVNFCQTSGNGLHATIRPTQDDSTTSLDHVGATNDYEENIYLRLQRVGNQIAGFYSKNGELWTPAKAAEDDGTERFPPQEIPTLKEQALIGMSITSHSDGDLATGKVDKVSLQPGIVSITALKGTGNGKAVLLEWPALKSAVTYTYNVYRGPAGATRDKMVKVNTDPIAGASFTDNSTDLVPGTMVTYAVAAVGKGADGNPVEGPLVSIEAAP
jgi:hypothetical protein